MIVDNLLKRGIVKPEKCVFCGEKESIHRLFFDCVVAKWLWEMTTSVMSSSIGMSYENVATFCLD